MEKDNKATPLKRAETSPLVLAASVSDRVQIRNVRCVDLRATCDLQGKPGPLAVEYVAEASATADAEGARILVYAVFGMQAGPENVPGSVLVQVKAKLELAYDCQRVEDFNSGTLKSFAQLNGIYNAWPYWREIVQSLVARMGLPPLVVPVFRIPVRPQDAGPHPAPQPTKGPKVDKEPKATPKTRRTRAQKAPRA
jgi:hypothetical protein